MPKKNLFNIDNLSAQDLDENSELIPLMTPEDEIEISKEELPHTLPILSLRNTVWIQLLCILMPIAIQKIAVMQARMFRKSIGLKLHLAC